MPKITPDCIDRLNHSLPISNYLTASQRYAREYACPFCESEHHVKIYDDNTACCMKCRESFDLIKLIRETTGADFVEAATQISEAANVPLEYEGKVDPKPEKSAAEKMATAAKENTPGKYKYYIADWKDDAEPAREYLRGRGLTDETIDRYDIGYKAQETFTDKETGEKIKLAAVVFSYNDEYSYYSARSLDGKHFTKPYANDAGDEPLFRPESLDDPRPCFIVESQIDALSLLQSGAPAVALCGTGYNKLLPAVKDRKTPLVLFLDNDPDGRRAQTKLADKLAEMGVPYILASFEYDKYDGAKKDANDLLCSNADQLREDVQRIIKTALRPDNIADYIKTQMPADIETLHQDAGRKTGFSNLDAEAGSLYSGLYFIGGISAVGKTTFVLQLANQLAESGQHVLFFSLEQSRLEMVSKSISCRTAINGDGVTAARIRQGKRDANIERAFREYAAAVGDRLSVIEGNFNCTVPFIEAYTRDYIQRNDARPVVIIDYLQILGAALDPETHRKQTDIRQIVNENVTGLKRLSRALSIPVIAVSSMNRANYLTPLDFESFRESSAIEYTADTILGVQLSAIHETLFESDPKKDVTKKRERINAAKNSNPREIELVCLKNRYGRNYSCTFKYFPQYDYFIPDDAPPGVPDDNDFHPAGYDPFDKLLAD